MTDRELMQQALEALVYRWDGCPADESLISKLNDRLAQPEPQPEWKNLTSAEIKVLWLAANNKAEFADLLQAKLREKNT
jgi:hypothetical protein